MNEPIIINTPEGIEHYRVSALITALRIEVKTGMKVSRISPLSVCKRDYGCPKNTKKGALAWMESYYEDTYGRTF